VIIVFRFAVLVRQNCTLHPENERLVCHVAVQISCNEQEGVVGFLQGFPRSLKEGGSTRNPHPTTFVTLVYHPHRIVSTYIHQTIYDCVRSLLHYLPLLQLKN
jgi:hypothetical protein